MLIFHQLLGMMSRMQVIDHLDPRFDELGVGSQNNLRENPHLSVPKRLHGLQRIVIAGRELVTRSITVSGQSDLFFGSPQRKWLESVVAAATNKMIFLKESMDLEARFSTHSLFREHSEETKEHGMHSLQSEDENDEVVVIVDQGRRHTRTVSATTTNRSTLSQSECALESDYTLEASTPMHHPLMFCKAVACSHLRSA